MKKSILLLIAISFCLLSFSQNYAVLRLGSTDASTISPGDQVLVPVYFDDFSSPVVLEFDISINFDVDVLSCNGDIMNIHPNFSGTWNLCSNEGYSWAIWIDPFFVGVEIESGEKLFDFVFIYQGGETDLTWNPGSGVGDMFNTTLIDGCICNPVNFPAIFHITAGGNPIQDATVTIEGDMNLTNEVGITVFDLQNGDYSFSVWAWGYDETSGTFSLSGFPQIIYVELEAEETFTLLFDCEASCENEFNGWNLAINNETLNVGESINLLAGEYDYSISWLDCLSTDSTINVTEQMEFDCGLILNPEPHVAFYVFSNEGGNVENAEVTIGSYSLNTDSAGKAVFCLPGGDYNYSILKNGYNPIYDDFSYINYCEDAFIEILIDPLDARGKEFANFQIYPNPSTGEFYIESVSGNESELDVSVMDIAGLIVYHNTFGINSNVLVDISDQKIGMYYLQIKSASMMYNSKLILK